MLKTGYRVKQNIWLSNLSILNIPDEGCYSRNASCAIKLISAFLLQRCLSNNSRHD